MSLHAADIQRYLQDCSQRGRIHMLLAPEHTSQMSILEIPGRFSKPSVLEDLFGECQAGGADARAMTELSRVTASVDAVPSLIEGVPVTDAIVALIANEALLQAMQGLRDDAVAAACGSTVH